MDPYRLPPWSVLTLSPPTERSGSNERRVLSSPTGAYQFHNCTLLYHWIAPPTASIKKPAKCERVSLIFSIFFLVIFFSWRGFSATKHSTLNAQQLKIIFHTIASQRSNFSPEDTNPGRVKKKECGKQSHTSTGWKRRRSGSRGLVSWILHPGPLCHADNLLPIFCQFFLSALGFASVMQQLKNYYVYNNFGFSSFFPPKRGSRNFWGLAADTTGLKNLSPQQQSSDKRQMKRKFNYAILLD